MPLSPSTSKTTALKFVDMINRRDFTNLATLFTSTATWAVLANSTKADWGGIFSAAEMCQRAAGVTGSFDTWTYIAKDIITDVEGTIVVVDGMCKGRGPGPLRYDNNYMMKLNFAEEGKISEVKETLDCYEVEIMFESMQAYSRESELKGVDGVISF